MSISLSRLDPNGADRSGLIDFFTNNAFPFHVHSQPRTVEEVDELISSGAFHSDENESYWLHHDDLGRIGCVRLEDLNDEAPLFDLRLATEFRGRGLGFECLRAITAHVFTTLKVDRIEGQTRDDNIAMRSTFIRAGWSKEAHYRQVWPAVGQAPRDSVAYAILRSEWESGVSLGVQWHDLPMFSPESHQGVVYTSNSVPEGDELNQLYGSVGWSAYTQDAVALHSSVMSSSHVVSARCDDVLVGLARVVSDFGSIVYLQDVLVHPDLHRRGIGRLLVTLALRSLSGVRQKVLFTDTDPEQRTFYESLGFREVSEDGQSGLRALVKV